MSPIFLVQMLRRLVINKVFFLFKVFKLFFLFKLFKVFFLF